MKRRIWSFSVPLWRGVYLTFHNHEQWDLGETHPTLCIHLNTRYRSTRQLAVYL